MRSHRALRLVLIGAALLAAPAARGQSYRGTLRCESGFVGVAITGLDFWCSDTPCANVAFCGGHQTFACPGLVLSVGGGNLSCSNVLDPDQIRDFTLAPCNNSVCQGPPQVTTQCRRWVMISYVCSTSPTITRSVCMRVPGSVGLTCPAVSAPGPDGAAGDPIVATFTLQMVLRETEVPSDCLPPPRSYAGEFHALYAAGLVDLRDPIHAGFTSCNPPPPSVPGATTLETFGSTVTAMVSMYGDPPTLVTAPAACTVEVTFFGMDGETRLFDTEMLSLDIAGGTLPAGVMIRESPTLPSTGWTTLRDVPGGFRMTSFFDVFTELSLDGGATWYPSTDESGVSYAGTMILQHDPTNPTDATPVPRVTALHRNVPNPFNPNTVIAFDLARSSPVRLEILSVAGQRLRRLVDASRAAGRHEVTWNGRDDAGNPVASGIYLYRLRAGDFVATRKLVLAK